MTQEDILRRAILNDEFPDSEQFFKSDSMAQMVPDRLKFERNAALGAWMSRVSGREVNASAVDWQANKDAIVRGFFKDSAASNVSDEQLHNLVKTHIQTSEEAADMAANMALQGKTSFEALKEMNAKRGPSLVRGIWDNYTKDLVQRHSVLSQKLAPYRGIVDSAASKLGKTMKDNLPASQDFQDIATQLLQVPEQDRHLVISAIGATGGATAEERASYLSKLAGAMGRMTETLGASSAGTMEQIGTTFEQLAQVPESIASALSGGVTMQGELASSKERSDTMLKAKENQQAFDILTQQIRQVADSEISPIKGDNWFSQIGIDVARMAPQVAVTVANPMLGTAANLSYFRNTVAAEAKSEDPSLTYQQADAIGALTAPFNAAVETFTTLIPFGKVKLPFLQKWLSTATTSVKGTARNFVIRGAASVGAEVTEEMAQAIAPLWTQQLMGAMGKDMSAVDWEKRMPDFSKIAAQTWGPALVFAIVGGGGASISEIKSGRALASDRDTMVATGMAPAMADQIATAAESGDWSKADTLFRQEFVSTTKATDEEKTAAVARIIETQKAQDGFRSSSERGADELERAQTIEKAMAELSGTRMFRDSEGWAVENTETNDVVRVSSREEAVGLVFGHLDEQEQRRAQAGAQLWDELYEKGGMGDEALRAESGSMDTQKQAARSPEDAVRVARGIETYAQLHGIPLDEARKIVFSVNGYNQDEQIENVRTAVSSVFGRGMNVSTVLHETTHGRWRAGLESGRFTHDQGLAWVRLAEQATGIDFLPSKVDSQISESLLDEAIVDVTVADAIGRRKDGGKFSAGLISRGMAALARGERNAMLGKDIDYRKASRAAGTFATWLKAWKEFWGQVITKGKALRKAKDEGKLGEDYDAFLDELMQASPQRRHEVAAAKEAMEIAQEGNMPFSLAPSQRGYLGTVASGGVIAVKVPSLAKAQHADFREIATEDDAKDFRYNPADETIYWWNPAKVSDAEKQQTADYLEGLGQTVKAQKGIKASDANYAAAHGVEPASFSLTPKDTEHLAAVEAGDMTKAQAMVDEAAEDGSYELWFHGNTQNFGSFAGDYMGTHFGDADAAQERLNQTGQTNGVVRGHYVKLKNPVKLKYDPATWYPSEFFGALPKDLQARMEEEWEVDDSENIIEALKEYGYDGVKYPNAFEGGISILVFNKSSIKSADPVTRDESGQVIPLSQRFNPETPDIRFSLAPRSLPEAEVISYERSDKFGSSYLDLKDDDGNWFKVRISDHDQRTQNASNKRPYEVTQALKRTFSIDQESPQDINILVDKPLPEQETKDLALAALSTLDVDARREAIEDGSELEFDAREQYHSERLQWAQIQANRNGGTPPNSEVRGILEKTPQKLAEAKSLLARIGDKSSFSLAPRSLPEVADTILAAQMKRPAFFEAFVTLARRRMDKLRKDGDWRVDKRGIASKRIGFDSRMAGNRSPANIEAERKFRLRSRQRELIDAGMLALPPEVLAAYDAGVASLEDVPMVKDMLGKVGKIMSKSAAQKSGKLKTDGKGSAGDYDGAPRLPPAWYAKSGGSMPYEIADQLSDMGHLKDGYADTLWDALRSAIYSTRTANEAFQKARDAVRKVEADALAQARKESDQWAKDEATKAPTEKEKQMMALRTLDAILSAFPPEIRAMVGGFVKLASFSTDAAREAEIIRRLEKLGEVIESEAKKHYAAKISKMLDKAAPVGKPGEVKKSKFIVTVQDEIDAISEMVGMDSDDVADSISKNEAAIISAQTPEAADAALTELNLLEIFGGVLDIKRTSSQELEVASEYLEELLKQGREARKMIDEARRERVKEMVNTAKSEAFKGDAGPETTQAAKSAAAKKSGQSMLKKFFNELSGFDAVLRDAFGADSKTAREFSKRFTLNSNNYEDVQNERRKRFRDFARELYGTKLGAKINQKLITLERIENNSGVTYLKGREVKAHKLTLDDAAKIVADPKALGFTAKDAAEIQEEMKALVASKGRRNTFTYEQVTNEGDRVEIPLSQMDALYVSMALRQPGILEQQQRYGYDHETVDRLEKFLTDEAKNWREWMQGEYDAEYDRANEVYMRMFNARMPKLMFYAPLLKNHQGQQAVLDPLNTGISSNSANPSSIKSRKARTSSLRIDSALSVFWSHFNQMEYWITNAEYLRDVQSVMLHPDVRQSVVSAHGEDGMATVSAWVQLQMSRGVGKAALATAGSKMFRNVKSAISMKALALNLSTTLKTIPSVFYSLGEIHMSKWPAALVSGMKHWDRLWKTNIIQRRLDIGGMPELRDLGNSALPMSWVNQGIRYGSYPTMYSDGVLTTYSAAMAYGTSFDEAKRQGAGDDVAHKYAEERTALIVSKTAQPENWTQKSLFENDLSGAGSLFFMFTSDPRQKLALTGEALNQWRKGSATTEEAMRKLLAYWIIPGIMFQLANAIGRSLFKGDDDEWEVVDFATAALVGQLQGLALIGSAAEMIFSAAIAAAAEKITGEEVKRKPFWNSPKNPLDGAANDLIKSVEKITDDDTKDGLGKTWEITKSAGMLLAPLSPAGAIPSTAERVMKDTTNLFYDDK